MDRIEKSRRALLSKYVLPLSQNRLRKIIEMFSRKNLIISFLKEELNPRIENIHENTRLC